MSDFDFSWTQTCTLHDPSCDVGIKTTLNAIPGAYATMSAKNKTRAFVTIDDPIDLGDGRGKVTKIEDGGIVRLSDLFEKHQASLAR
jgi:hypothetical protein